MGRVLIVDHDGDSREALEVIAGLWSYEVATAGNAVEGLEKLKSFHPHVMITNRGLPGVDGEQLVRMVREGGDTRTFIVCLTGYSDETTLARIRSAGCDLVLVKPIDHSALERALADACARAASEVPRP